MRTPRGDGTRGLQGGPATGSARIRVAAVGVVGLLAVLVVYLGAVRTPPGRWLDQVVYTAVLERLPTSLRLGLAELSRPVLPVVLAGILLLLAPLALARGRWRETGAAAFVATAVPATALLRSSVLPPHGLAVDGSNGYPSTHAVVGLVGLVGVALLWPRDPRRLERWVAGVLVVVIPVGNVTWYAHRPADVLGSTLLVAAFSCLAWGVFAPDVVRAWPPRATWPGTGRPSPAVREESQN